MCNKYLILKKHVWNLKKMFTEQLKLSFWWLAAWRTFCLCLHEGQRDLSPRLQTWIKPGGSLNSDTLHFHPQDLTLTQYVINNDCCVQSVARCVKLGFWRGEGMQRAQVLRSETSLNLSSAYYFWWGRDSSQDLSTHLPEKSERWKVS